MPSKERGRMTFQLPPSGTRGPRFPAGPLIRGMMRLAAGVDRLTGGRSSSKTLLLTTVGARTGEQRVASLRRFDEGKGQWLIVGSKGGAAAHPAWVHNLARNPDKAWVELGRERFKVKAELLAGEDRAAAWNRI